MSLDQPTRYQTDKEVLVDSAGECLSDIAEVLRKEEGVFIAVSREPLIFFYYFDEEKLVSASSISSNKAANITFPKLYNRIPDVPVERLLPLVPSSNVKGFPMTLRFSVVPTQSVQDFPTISLSDSKKLMEFCTSMMSDLAKFRTVRIDELTKNQALVQWLLHSELYPPHDFVIDYQGYRTNTSSQVTEFKSRPDLVVCRKRFVSKAPVKGAVARYENGHRAGAIKHENYEDDLAVFGLVNQLKNKKKAANLYQLIADMVKVSGDLAVRSVLDGQLFRYIHMYGLLIECDTDQAESMKLTMDFQERTTTLVRSSEELNIGQCFERLACLL